mgnify:CR=1 FL=1
MLKALVGCAWAPCALTRGSYHDTKPAGEDLGETMNKILDTTGINLPALFIHVPEGAWLIAVFVLLGIVLGVAFVSRSRARFSEKHLRHKMRSSAAKAVHYDAGTRKVLVVTASGETEIPRKPYKDGTLPATGFEGFTPREILGGAFRLSKQPLVELTSWKTKRFFGRRHWRIEPKSNSPVVTDTPQPPKKKDDRQKPAPAAASDGRNRDQRPDRDQRPEAEAESVH